MNRWACLILVCLSVIPAVSQVAPEATGGSGDDSQMAVPPPVSVQSYPTEVGSEIHSNYLRGGIRFATSYIDNLYAGSSAPLSETTFSVYPTISYDQTTTRQHRTFTYSPGFTFYQPSSALNEVDHSLNALYQYRLTPHTTINASDSFQQSSTSFGLTDSSTGGAVSGSPQPFTPGIIAPFAERLSNTANAQFSYQFSPVGMVGISGTIAKLNYPNSSETPGLYNSDNRGGGAFYNRRLSATQYAGLNYQYSMILAYPQNSQETTQTHTIDGFYTIYFKPNLSFSLSGGPQYYSTTQTGSLTSGSWGPMVMASMNWQGTHTNLAASYSRQVTAGGGLLGAFKSDSSSLSARWQITQQMSAGTSISYADNRSVTPFLSLTTQNGHGFSAEATFGYMINSQFALNFEYDRARQIYSGVAAIAVDPNSDRETVSLTWQFARPLGR